MMRCPITTLNDPVGDVFGMTNFPDVFRVVGGIDHTKGCTSLYE